MKKELFINRNIWGVAALCIGLLLNACGSSRKAVSEVDMETGASTVEPVSKADKLTQTTITKVQENKQTATGIRAKASVSLGSLSASGTMKMKRDEIIQLSLSAFFGIMEVGRLEMTPKFLFVQDRVNHQYVKVVWDGVPQLREAGINYDTFQSLFWGELFAPGKTGTLDIADFESEKTDSYVMIRPKTQPDNQYAIAVKFLVEATSGLIRQASITPAKVSSLNLAWDYSDWTSLNGKSFPSEMQMTLASGTDTNTVKFKLSSVQADEQLSVTPFPTPDSNSYTHINITRLFKRLMQ